MPGVKEAKKINKFLSHSIQQTLVRHIKGERFAEMKCSDAFHIGNSLHFPGMHVVYAMTSSKNVNRDKGQ